jgi:hypothetical protein
VEEGGSVDGSESLNVAVKLMNPSACSIIIHDLYILLGGMHRGREVIVTPTVKKNYCAYCIPVIPILASSVGVSSGSADINKSSYEGVLP